MLSSTALTWTPLLLLLATPSPARESAILRDPDCQRNLIFRFQLLEAFPILTYGFEYVEHI